MNPDYIACIVIGALILWSVVVVWRDVTRD